MTKQLRTGNSKNKTKQWVSTIYLILGVLQSLHPFYWYYMYHYSGILYIYQESNFRLWIVGVIGWLQIILSICYRDGIIKTKKFVAKLLVLRFTTWCFFLHII